MSAPTLDSAAAQQPAAHSPKPAVKPGLLDPKMLLKSIPDALRKLDPRTMWRNPVMFIVEIGAVWSTILAVASGAAGRSQGGETGSSWFAWLIVAWLWLTVIFANLAEAVAEGRGKAQADALRRAKTDTMARRLAGWAPGRTVSEEAVPAPELRQGDHVVVEAGEII